MGLLSNLEEQMPENDVVNVASLWGRLEAMEGEKRFDGRSYPEGMSCFPFRLKGQGFFPGGDGFWRAESQLAQVSSGRVVAEGIMFLGNDFGTLKSYEKLRLKSFESPPTWKRVKARVERAGLPSHLTFFTNAVMGLRVDGTALDKRDLNRLPRFKAFCREFLVYQIETLRPKLVVVMGPNPRTTLDSLDVGKTIVSGKFPKMRIGSQVTTAYFSTHPYGDFNFSEVRKTSDASELREAWDQAQPRN
jgi:hypothetical protein